MFDEEQRNDLVDMIRTRGWQIFCNWNAEAIENYRNMIIQAPSSILEADRTYYAGIAKGRQEAVEILLDLISKK